MIQEVFAKILLEKKGYKVLVRISTILFIGSLIMLAFFGKIGEEIYISENAVNAKTTSYEVESLFSDFKRFQHLKSDLIRSLESRFDDLGIKIETLSYSKYEKNFTNHIWYFRPKRSLPKECDIISFFYDSKNAVLDSAFVSALVNFFQRDDVNYISKDILIVGLQESENGESTKLFLNEYFSNSARLKSRCGILRHAIHINLESENSNALHFSFSFIFNKIVGINQQVPDIDFVALFNKGLHDLKIPYTTSRINKKRLREIDTTLSNIINKIHQLIFSKPFKVNLQLTDLYSEVINGVFANTSLPHPHFLQQGIHGVSFVSFKSNNSKLRSDDLIKKLFKLVITGHQALNALDEKLHAGSTFYFFTSKSEFLTIARYFQPAVFSFMSVLIPGLASYYSTSKIGVERLFIESLENYTFGGFVFVLISLFEISSEIQIYVSILFSYLLSKFIIYSLRKIFSIDIIPESFEIARLFMYAPIGYGGIFWTFLNLGLGLIVVAIIAPFLLLIRPLSTKFKDCIINVLLSMLMVWIFSILKLEIGDFGFISEKFVLSYNLYGGYGLPFLCFTFLPAINAIVKLFLWRIIVGNSE